MAEKRTVAELEVNLIYSMSWAMDRLLLDIESRLKGKGDGLQREKKRAFNNLMDAINRAYRASAALREDIELASSRSGYKELDIWAVETNELCRLLLLWTDRCDTEETTNQVFKLLRSFEGDGIITEDVLKSYYLKK